MSSPTPRPATATAPASARVAGVLTAVEAAVLVAAVAFYLYELVQGVSPDPTRVVMSMVVIALFAVGLAVLARAWLGGRAWPRTPTIVWNLLLLPVAYSLSQAGLRAVSAAIGVVALASIGAALASPRPDADRE